MALAAQKVADYFTYADYILWPADERWELLNGEAYLMAAPQRLHQEVVLGIGAQLFQYFQGKPCKPYIAPFDVRLPHEPHNSDEQITTVVQPDILVVCDRRKLDDKGCRGAPDWIIEVLSPSTAIMDMSTKHNIYQQHGIKEYWIVHPTEQWIMLYTLETHGEYGKPRILSMAQSTSVALFPELSIDWSFLHQDMS